MKLTVKNGEQISIIEIKSKQKTIRQIMNENGFVVSRYIYIEAGEIVVADKFPENDVQAIKIIFHDKNEKEHRYKEITKCAYCSAKPITVIYENNLGMCKKHFFRYMQKKFMRNIREYNMIKKNSRVAVGISGGKDSLVLLDLLIYLKTKLPFEIVPIHIQKNNELDESIKKAQEHFGIKFKIVRFLDEYDLNLEKLAKIIKKLGHTSVCSYCGILTRQLLNKIAIQEKCDVIAIGHNLDDMAQTFIMNISKADISRTLRTLPKSKKQRGFVQRIRPLFNIEERHIGLYAYLKSLNFEQKKCEFSSFAFREHIRLLIDKSEEIYPGFKRKILASMLEYQKNYEEKEWEMKTCKICGQPSSKDICKVCEIKKEFEKK